MSWLEKLKGVTSEKVNETMTEVKCVGLKGSKLAEVMTANLYTRIIHKCFTRAIVPKEVKEPSFNMSIYDSYSPFKRGLASIIVIALVEMKQIFVKVSETDNGVKLFTVLDTNATENERNASDVIELDFRKFYQVEVINLLYLLIQGVLSGIDNGITVSQAMVFKLHKLSEMVQNNSTDKVLREQLEQLNEAISQGNAGFIDAQSDIVFPTYDATPAQTSLDLLYGMIANITGLPMAFINSETVGGLGSTDSSDNQRLNDAIEYYYYNICNNILYSVYNRQFGFQQFVNDLNGTISMFAFIETTTLLTDAGKLKFMTNNTGFAPEDINIQAGEDKAKDADDSSTTKTDVTVIE